MVSTAEVLSKLRSLCLALPETHEVSSWGHPNFRAGKRVFAAFEVIRERPSIAFGLNDFGVEALLQRPEFFATPYGRGQWVSIWADVQLDWPLIADLLQRSYRVVALKRMKAALERPPGKT